MLHAPRRSRIALEGEPRGEAELPLAGAAHGVGANGRRDVSEGGRVADVGVRLEKFGYVGRYRKL